MTLTYEATIYSQEILTVYEFNFFGGLFNIIYYTDPNYLIPLLQDEGYPITSFLFFMFSILIILNLFLGNISTSINIKSKKKKIICILIIFSSFLLIYVILLFFNYYRINEIVKNALILQDQEFDPNIDRFYYINLNPNFLYYYLYPLIFIPLGFFIHYFLYNNLIDKNHHLIYEDGFMSSFVKKVKDQHTETEYWDFKELLDWWNPRCAIKEKKQIEFCETVASFANAEGGLIIIGITDRTPRIIEGVPKIEERIKNVYKVLNKWLDPKDKFYHIRELILKDGNNNDRNCILIAIYQTNTVIAVKQTNNHLSYNKREGPGSINVSRDDLNKEKKNILRNNLYFFDYLIQRYKLRI